MHDGMNNDFSLRMNDAIEDFVLEFFEQTQRILELYGQKFDDVTHAADLKNCFCNLDMVVEALP